MMKTFLRSLRLFVGVMLLGIVLPTEVPAQPARVPIQELPLDDLGAFEAPGTNWQVAGTVYADRHERHHLAAEPGTGILVNLPDEVEDPMPLFTTWEHGDLRLELDFLMPTASNSGIYLMGRYELQLYDSWGVKNPTYGDCGGIYQRWDPNRPEGERGFEGHAPRMNAARAPGLWQHLAVVFRAPRFDATGEKVENARFVKVALNGVVIHRNVELTGPTRGAPFPNEEPTGPLMIQGDHGPIAFRNIRYEPDPTPRTASAAGEDAAAQRVDPIWVRAEGRPVVQRSFVMHGGAKRTHAVSVGAPSGTHYSLDLNQDALLKVWKGAFLDVTAMWHERGEPQLARPRGSVLELSGAPSLAFLEDENAPWPDSLRPYVGDRFQGYVLDDAGRPSFHYLLGAVAVTDRLGPEQGGRMLTRTLTFRTEEESTADLWLRAAASRRIERLPDGAYDVGGHTFYVEVRETSGAEPRIRDVAGHQELLIPVPLESGRATLSYSIIW